MLKTAAKTAIPMAVLLILAACGGQATGSPGGSGGSGDGSGIAGAYDFASELVEDGKLTIATSGTYPPLTSTGSGGELEGFEIDLCTEIASDLGVEVEFVKVDFAGILPGLTTGRWDMVCSGVTASPERLESPELFLAYPVMRHGIALSVLADSPIEGLADVDGLRMGGIAGSIDNETVQAAITALGVSVETTDYPGLNEMMLDLQNDRIDFAVTDTTGGGAFAVSDPSVRIIEAVGPGITPLLLAPAVAISHPNLLAAVNRSIIEMRRDGRLLQLHEEWFGADVLPQGVY